MFWNKEEKIVNFTKTLIKVLQMVDGDNPTMGCNYDAIEQAKEPINAYQRWIQKLHRPLHAARYFLNLLITLFPIAI
jgi:hypothetical protein